MCALFTERVVSTRHILVARAVSECVKRRAEFNPKGRGGKEGGGLGGREGGAARGSTRHGKCSN